VSRSSSTRDAGSQRANKTSQDISKVATPDAAANPDPAVFEQAFKDTLKEDDQNAAPPTAPVKDTAGDTNGQQDTKAEGLEDQNGNGATTPAPQNTEQADVAASPTVSPEVRAKLARLAKLEDNYKSE
jgi:hypothetical protein